MKHIIIYFPDNTPYRELEGNLNYQFYDDSTVIFDLSGKEILAVSKQFLVVIETKYDQGVDNG